MSGELVHEAGVIAHEQATSQPPTPMAMIQLAVQQGADIDKLEKLMALQERWEKNEARKAFHAAFAAFKTEAVAISRNKKVTDGPLKGKSYAELHAVVDAITPALSKHGLSASWRLSKDEKDWLEVTCTITHTLGHAESVSMASGPDTGGAKNHIQARASTVTYLERYTLLAATGLAAGGTDDDGAQGKSKEMPEGTKANWLAAIDACSDMETWEKTWAACVKVCQEIGDIASYDDLKAAAAAKRKALKTKGDSV